jgi:hypothetical protein
MITHMDNRNKLGCILAFERASLRLLCEWNAIHALAKNVLRALVKNPEKASSLMALHEAQFCAIYWSAMNQIALGAPSDEELSRGVSEEGVFMCAKLMCVILRRMHDQKPLIWLKRKGSIHVSTLFRVLLHFGLASTVAIFDLEPPLALTGIISVPDSIVRGKQRQFLLLPFFLMFCFRGPSSMPCFCDPCCL